MGDIQSSLLLIEALLRKHEYHAHAEIVEKCRGRLTAEGDSDYTDFATLDWWGGSGSIADIYLCRKHQDQSNEMTEDNRALRSALLDVYDAMTAHGVGMNRATHWADVFREWKQKGI